MWLNYGINFYKHYIFDFSCKKKISGGDKALAKPAGRGPPIQNVLPNIDNQNTGQKK